MRTLLVSAAALAVVAGPASAATLTFAPATPPTSGAVAVPISAAGAFLGAGATLDAAAQEAAKRAMTAAAFEGKAGKTLVLHGIGPYRRLALIGVGDGPKTATDLEDFGGRAATALGDDGGAIVTPDAPDIAKDAVHVAFGARLAAYDFGKYGASPRAPKSFAIVTADAPAAETAWTSEWRPVAEATVFTRDLVSTPSNVKTPQWFVDQVRARAKGVAGVTTEVLDERAMERLGMGALLSVGQGSTRPPRLLAVRYQGAGTAAPIAIVGKGITFDSGGISIKPGAGMWEMRTDMAGAATAVATVLALAERRAPVNAVAIAALAENMPSGSATRPGDVVKSLSGKSIEVLNTDAEGRMVLADGLTFVQQRDKPQAIFTVATLTGAAVRALGDDYAALMTEDDTLAQSVTRAGTLSGEAVWRLPIHASVKESLKADVADLRNVVEGGSEPGAQIGGAFLMEFVAPTTPFAHLDIAGTAWRGKGLATVPKGATGYGVRLLDRLVRETYEPRLKGE